MVGGNCQENLAGAWLTWRFGQSGDDMGVNDADIDSAKVELKHCRSKNPAKSKR